MTVESLPGRPRAAHLLGWLGAGLVYLLTVLPFYAGTVGKIVAFKAVWSVVGWGIAEGLGRLYGAWRVGTGRPSRTAARVVVASVLVGAFWVAVMAGISIAVQGNTLLFFTPTFFPFILMNHVFILLAWSGGWVALTYWRRAQADARRLLEAESAARAAQLELLRLQLHPHFLFNSLASLRALIQEDPEGARRMVTRLSAFLRYALASRERPWVPVHQELELLGAYLEIERTRFGDRLDILVDTDAGVRDEPVPSLLLLSLVENAVKHGGEADGRLRVEISARRDRGDLVLAVRNTGSLAEARTAAPPVNGRARAGEALVGGYGLANLRERLASAYGGRATLTLAQDDDMVDARIRVGA